MGFKFLASVVDSMHLKEKAAVETIFSHLGRSAPGELTDEEIETLNASRLAKGLRLMMRRHEELASMMVQPKKSTKSKSETKAETKPGA